MLQSSNRSSLRPGLALAKLAATLSFDLRSATMSQGIQRVYTSPLTDVKNRSGCSLLTQEEAAMWRAKSLVLHLGITGQLVETHPANPRERLVRWGNFVRVASIRSRRSSPESNASNTLSCPVFIICSKGAPDFPIKDLQPRTSRTCEGCQSSSSHTRRSAIQNGHALECIRDLLP